MIYTIIKTSFLNDKTPPIEKVFKLKHESWQTRSCTEEYFNINFSGKEGLWRSKGTNHIKVEGDKWISRRVDDAEKWSIEINTLEELMALVRDHGDIIVKACGINTVTPEIEIYNAFTE